MRQKINLETCSGCLDRRVRRRKGARLSAELLEPRLAPTVSLSVADPMPFPEGNSGAANMMFVVSRSGDLAPALTVDFTTRDGTGEQLMALAITNNIQSLTAQNYLNRTCGMLARPLER